jgi:hypothetical protein
MLDYGLLVHPTLGALAYEIPPDEWVNVDQDVIIAPTWTSTKTLTSSANVMWPGNIRDVLVEEKWTQQISMSIGMFRELLNIWTNPVDPSTSSYVAWYPNYINQNGYLVLPMKLSVGGSDIFSFSDVVNSLDVAGDPNGWLTQPVTLSLKIISKLAPLALPLVLLNGSSTIPYSQSIAATGGLPSYTYTLSAGVLPTGLVFDPTTALLSGTVATPVIANFSITVVDSAGITSTQAYALTII